MTASSILRRLLSEARNLDYQGHNKHDGLLSPVLGSLLGWGRIPRLLAIQLVTRSPFNIRPLLDVPRSRNPKGMGLFARASLQAFSLLSDERYLAEAESLLSKLREYGNTDLPGISWGYQYPWQDVGFFAPANSPNRVVTCWIGLAFFEAWKTSKKQNYLDMCLEICRFLRETPNRLVDTAEELCLTYVPQKDVTWSVMDVSALSGRMLALTGVALSDSGMLEDARRCIQYVVNRQTDYGAWFYTDPPGDSHIKHDNYHTGIILDCIYDYGASTGSNAFWQAYEKGLAFYAENLFLEDGAPKWMNDRNYPHDVHGAAQGIISFSKATQRFPESREMAEKILEWTLADLYDEKSGGFWYQKTWWGTKRFTLLRWCNAWMAVALGEWLGIESNSG